MADDTIRLSCGCVKKYYSGVGWDVALCATHRDYTIYLSEENAAAVAADTDWTVEQLTELLRTSPNRWRVCISGIRVEDT